MDTIEVSQALARLRELAAHEIKHVHGDLLAHLKGTHDLLTRWGNSRSLSLAGLFRAVYGTADFPLQLIALDRRSDVVNAIGKAAEEIVYFYGACDRRHTYRQIIIEDKPTYRDRFSGDTYVAEREILVAFCELTLANELEIVAKNAEHLEKYRSRYVKLFPSFEPYVSSSAFQAYKEVFA